VTAEKGAKPPAALRVDHFRLGQSLTVLSLVAGGIFLLDVFTPPSLDLPILYMFVVLLCLRSSWPAASFVAAAAAIVLIFIPPAFLWTAPMEWSIAVNRAIAAVAVGVTAVLVSNRRVAEAAVMESQAELSLRVEERTAQLRKVNQALETEIATHRATERSLQDSLDRLARTEAFSSVMVTHVGLNGRWLKVPSRLADLLGYSDSELLTDTFMSVTHPDDIDADWSQCQRLIRGESKSFELEKRYIRKDGGIVWVYLNCCGVYDAEGRLLHFLTYIRDISELKQVETALRESETKWRRVMETVPIGIGLSTLDGRVLDVNPAAWKMFGYESKEDILHAGGVSHPMDAEDRAQRLAAIRSGQHVVEAEFKKKDGSMFWARCTAAILSDADHDTVLIDAYEDITEERRTHDTLERAKEELQASNQRLMERDQSRTKFLSVVSHELRKPMAAIKGFVDNMLSGVTGEVSEHQTTYLTRIRSNIDRLTRLIAQILDWSRLEMGALQLTRTRVLPTDIIRVVGENAQAIASAKSIGVSLVIEPDLPALQADSDKLEQVLWNLIGNAIKFTPSHGRVTVECRRAGHEAVLFVVSDTGCGIPPEELPRVFEQFSGVNSPAAFARGAQLGLYITQRLVILHGGRIWVESAVGRGSRFSVELPVVCPNRGGTQG